MSAARVNLYRRIPEIPYKWRKMPWHLRKNRWHLNLPPEMPLLTEADAKLIGMKSKVRRETGVYQMLNLLEDQGPYYIKQFWNCVFKDHLLKQYPTLRLLRNSLLDGSFMFYEKVPEEEKMKEEKEVKKNKEDLEEKGEKVEEEKRTKKKKDKMRKVLDEEKEQLSTYTQSPPRQKRKAQKPTFSTPLKKGEKAEIWTWGLYKAQLPVTCGNKTATLYWDKLAKGEDCILTEGRWFTPICFEEFAGKKSCRNWKTSIRCGGATLEKLIQEGHLHAPNFKRTTGGQAKRARFSSNQSGSSVTGAHSECEEDEEEEAEPEREEGREEQTTPAGAGSSAAGNHVVVKQSVFKVTCGDIEGMLHTGRFASGSCGKSVRTEDCWMTPVEFVSKGSALEEASWKKDILYDGKPLSVLIENEVLVSHTLLCKCRLCSPTTEVLEEQKNDDDCFICGSQGTLICCEDCPRSFHQRCHLPNVDDAVIKISLRWLCTFCVMRTSLSWRYPNQKTYQDVLTGTISEHLLECQYLLLFLYHQDPYNIFVKDPRSNVKNYSRVIQHPMWLDKVVEKLQNSHYQTLKSFVSDVSLIFTNCATFNRDNAEFREMGENLKDLFDREFKNTFCIQPLQPTSCNYS